MPTHAIGTGTQNINLNLPVDEKAIWGKVAFRLGFRSTGSLFRKSSLLGLEQIDPQAAAEIKATRIKYYGSAALLCVFMLTFASHDEMTRARRGRRIEEVREEEAIGI